MGNWKIDNEGLNQFFFHCTEIAELIVMKTIKFVDADRVAFKAAFVSWVSHLY